MDKNKNPNENTNQINKDKKSTNITGINNNNNLGNPKVTLKKITTLTSSMLEANLKYIKKKNKFQEAIIEESDGEQSSERQEKNNEKKENKIRKKYSKKKTSQFSISEKKLPKVKLRNLNKIDTMEEGRFGFQKKGGKAIGEEKDDQNIRALTPKKIKHQIKNIPFELIDEVKVIEPQILKFFERPISLGDTEENQSIFESFFIASLPKEEHSMAEDLNNPGVSCFSRNLGQCGHESCFKLPSYKAGLIFQYPKKDKNPQNFEITDLVTSLCFPFGLKICFGKYSDKKNDVIKPKKPHDFYFITTNGYNDQNFVYVYNFYVKMKIEDFKKNYKCDPVVNYLNILIKNNDKNFQEKFAECQNMISSQYVYIPHVCCLVSKYPYFKQMKQSIYSILNIRNNEEELIKFLKHIIYEIPDINKYQEYDLQLNFFTPHNMLPIVLKSNNYNRGLNIDLKYMGIILEYFQISLLIKIFKFMLTSQKLLFVVNDSSEYKILSLVTLALLNILYPFNWKYTYIPLLSFSMLKFLQSFLPFIMGIDNNMLEYSKNNYIDKQSNIIIIVLKKNKKSFIQEENPDENADIEIPTKLKDMLINNLKII